jgi:uncharacterized protein
MVVALGALLHDADDGKLFGTEHNEHARAFLSSQGVEPQTAEKILSVINDVSFSKNRDRKPELPEGCIVRDADRLDAIGAVGIARTFAYGGKHGRGLQDSIAHFHEKLLLLKDMMLTEKAKEIAEKEKIIQYSRDMKQKMEVEAEIIKLSGKLESLEDILAVDEFVQEILKKT